MADPIRLSTDGAYKQHLAISPDGTRLAFTRHRALKSPQGAVRNQLSVCVADLLETPSGRKLGEIRQLTPDQPDFAARMQPCWSPDGMKIAYVNIRLSGTDGQLDLHLMNPDGTGDTKLMSTPGFERYPAISPDGKRIAYAATVPGESGKSSIFVAELDGKATGITGTPVRLTNHNSQDESPTWSPDGKRLAFNSNFEGNQELYACDPDGKNVTRLTNHPALDVHPSWSPDGKRIVLVSYRDGNKDLFVMEADGSRPVNISTSPSLDDDPCWHPDSQQIAFVSNRSGRFEVYLVGV